jgi:hypothetical protein
MNASDALTLMMRTTLDVRAVRGAEARHLVLL